MNLVPKAFPRFTLGTQCQLKLQLPSGAKLELALPWVPKLELGNQKNELLQKNAGRQLMKLEPGAIHDKIPQAGMPRGRYVERHVPTRFGLILKG